MKKVIWKFELDHKGNQEIELPIDYEILTIQVQNETPCLWVLVDPSKPKEKEIFERKIRLLPLSSILECNHHQDSIFFRRNQLLEALSPLYV